MSDKISIHVHMNTIILHSPFPKRFTTRLEDSKHSIHMYMYQYFSCYVLIPNIHHCLLSSGLDANLLGKEECSIMVSTCTHIDILSDICFSNNIPILDS